MFLVSALVLTTAMAPPSAAAEAPSAEQVRRAVERSLVTLDRGARDWWYGNTQVGEKDGRPALVKGPQKNCGSCHHVPMAVWNLTEAKKHGLAVDDRALDELRDWAYTPYVKDPDLKPVGQDKFGGGKVSLNTIYLSLAAAADPAPDEKTLDAMKKFAAHLIDKQEADGSWKAGRTGYEPPIGDITEVLTMQALLVLATAHDKSLLVEDRWTQCRDRALEWLSKAQLSDRHQTLAMQALVKQVFGKPEEVQASVKELLKRQNADGGWSQLKEMPSDAMATGQTLYVLARLGVKDQQTAVQRAQGFLVRTQAEDGSWWVPSREKGRKGLASSYYGSAWATLGLIQTLPPSEKQPATPQTEKQP